MFVIFLCRMQGGPVGSKNESCASEVILNRPEPARLPERILDELRV